MCLGQGIRRKRERKRKAQREKEKNQFIFPPKSEIMLELFCTSSQLSTAPLRFCVRGGKSQTFQKKEKVKNENTYESYLRLFKNTLRRCFFQVVFKIRSWLCKKEERKEKSCWSQSCRIRKLISREGDNSKRVECRCLHSGESQLLYRWTLGNCWVEYKSKRYNLQRKPCII